MNATYTSEHIGCYVDGARGIYTVDAILTFAKVHGYHMGLDKCDQTDCQYCYGQGTLADCLNRDWEEDQIGNYMNSEFEVDGCYWGRSEQGDWGLWPCEGD